MSNNQKLREALEAVIEVGYPHNFQREAPHIRGYCYDITKAIDKCFAALAEPIRNCDIGTAEEQAERFMKFCSDHQEPWHGCSNYCPVLMSEKCAITWAQLPYEKGEAE